MPTLFNPNRRKGIFMIPSGATKSPTPAPPSFTNTYSLSLDGVDDFVNAGSSIPNLETGDISFSAWVYPTSFSSYNYFLDSGAITTKKGIFAGLQITTGFVALLRKTGVTNTRCSTGWIDCGLTINNWYNIVGVFDEDGGTAGVGQLKLYVNGVLKATVDGSGQDTGTGYDLHIGKDEGDFSHFVGNIDEVSLYNYPLTSGNVTSIYNLGVPNNLDDLTTPPTAWYRNGDNGSYKSPQWLIPENSNKDKVSNYSYLFDGVDDFVDVGSASNLNFTGAFTLSVWAKKTGTGSGSLPTLFNSAKNSSNQGGYILCEVGSIWKFYVWNGSAWQISQADSTIVNDNWYNIIAIYDNSIIKLYVNGVLQADTETVASVGYASVNQNAFIGEYVNNHFNGNIDEISLWGSDQSANVASIYNSGTPTTITGATAHWKMGEQANFTDNWLVNNSALSNYSTRSFNFDGVDDYVDFGNDSSLQITTDLSVSFWFKGSSTADQAIVAKDGLGGSRCWGIWNNVFGAGNNLQFYIFNSNSLTEVQTSANYNDGNWHNVVCIFKPSTYLRIYVDGVLDGENTTSIPATIDNDSANLTVGAIVSSGSPLYEFEGNVDEVAIWNADKSSDVATIYNSGTPADLTSLSPVSWWRMGEDATFSTNWSLPDNGSASNTGTSANMTIADLEGDASNYTGGGLSANMTIEDRVGDAPNSTSNAVSFNMTESDRETDVPS